jgi:hypothetical protein
MKLNLVQIKKIFPCVFFIFCSQHLIFSQGTDISTRKKPGMFIGLGATQSQSNILNEGTLTVSKLLSEKATSLSYSMEIGYFFSDFFGLSTGAGYNTYKAHLTLSDYQSKFTTTDDESETYEMRITGSGITEDQEIIYLGVPLCLNLRIPLGKTIGIFLQAGANVSIPLSQNYKSSGTFTYKGYYPAYNVVLENLPNHGFPSNENNNSEGELELKPLVYDAVASAGLDLYLFKKVQIVVAGCYDKSLSNISNYALSAKYQLSTDADHMNSLMEGSSTAIAQSMGVKICLRFYL